MKPFVAAIGMLLVAAASMMAGDNEHMRYVLPEAGVLGKPRCTIWPYYNGCCPDDYCPKPFPPCPPLCNLPCAGCGCKKGKYPMDAPCPPFYTCGPGDGCCKDPCRPWRLWLH
jgi:hypothetical protein